MKPIKNIIYLYIHSMMFQKFGEFELSEKELTSYLYEWRMPKELRPLIIKELECLDLLELSGKRPFLRVQLKRSYFSLEDKNKYYELLDLF